MKKVGAFAFLLLCAAAAHAQGPVPSLDYGTRVNIEPGYETFLDLSYRQDPDTHGMFASGVVRFLQFSVWAPDGKRIYFSDDGNIFSVPVSGGKPRLEFESNLIYPYNGKRYILSQTIRSLIGISPDGKKLYFTRLLIGEGSGAQITITEHFEEDGGWGAHITGGTAALECLDLETGMTDTLARNANFGALSRSGRYLEYCTGSPSAIRVLDLVSGEEWDVPVSSLWAGFSPDEQGLRYAASVGNIPKFFEIPIRGGDPRQLTSSPGVTGTPRFPDWTPDGEWVIYTLSTGESYSNSGTMPGGGKWSFTKGVEKLCLSNLKTGGTTEVVPFSKSIDPERVRFSPDGKQICYIRRDWENPDDEWALYIKDISLPDLDTGGQVSVADAAPEGFALTGNYPNPFNPSTHISFTLPSSGMAQMRVYDVTGRTVRTLISSTLSAGAHEMVWDGRDDSGAAVSSGTYIARLKMGNLSASHRMLLVK